MPSKAPLQKTPRDANPSDLHHGIAQLGMEQPTLQQRQERLRNASPKMRDVIWAEETGETIESIAMRHGVEDKTSNLSEITSFVLLGFLPIQKFRSALQEELNIPEEQARQIAQEIRERIFAQVAEELRKLHKLP